ncbi:hypothetical protein AURANDRAFT_5943, partial [Aureococcus anophagefferens]
DIGVFLGMMNSDNLLSVSRIPGPYDMTGNGISAAGARLSFVFAMRGPCISMDTACSSSLVATHIAECAKALSQGSNMILSPSGAFLMFAIAGMLSRQGRCHTFDQRANGYSRAEGYVAMFNSRYRTQDEPAQDEPGLAYLGSCCLHNGQSATFTALNGSSQRHLLRRVGVTAICFVEAHGTGTSLGDP